MATRPSVGIRTATGEASGSIPLPAVFSAPLRHDIVRFVHTNVSKNSRQPYAVSRKAGHRATAESWGTGRAVSRIPRVGGGGSSRSGEGAYGNMCKGGRMFAPTKVFRRWNRAVNKNLRRYAVTSSVVASGIPALVMARGHKIEKISELPLVVSDKVQGLTKTKDAVKVLQALKAFDDVRKVKDTTKVRAGVGKMRNRRYVQRKGPLVVLSKNEGGWRAFRNIPGIDLAFVSALNILQLAPGGHLGRFIIWTESAFRELDNVFGTLTKGATTRKYKMPRGIMSNTDVGAVINSDEVQSVIRKKRVNTQRAVIKQNPLRNRGAMTKLTPFAKDIRRRVKSQLAKGATKTAGKPAAKTAAAAKPAAKTEAKPVAAAKPEVKPAAAAKPEGKPSPKPSPKK